MNKLFALIVSALLITLVHTSAHAMGPAHRINFVSNTAGCTPYTHGMVLQSYANELNHTSCKGSGSQNSDNTDKPAVSVPVANTPVTSVPVVNTPIVHNDPAPVVTDNTPVSPVAGNPGNTKNVGHAGENPNNANTMPLDNAGGDGNGEHGNQGVNH